MKHKNMVQLIMMRQYYYVCLLWFGLVVAAVTGSNKYYFYRGRGRRGGGGGGAGDGGGRRVFGGAVASLDEFPNVVALLDRYWSVRCMGAAVSPQWVVTAAHCVCPHLAYVTHSSVTPTPSAPAQPIAFLYRHPQYQVRASSDDVSLLQHDVGLVRTRRAMRGVAGAPVWGAVDVRSLVGERLVVLGYGRSESGELGERLYRAELTLDGCERGADAWQHVVCAVGGAGVCAGDSGGPAVHAGRQVAVTSMGPLQCGGDTGGSVLTALAPYEAVLNATLAGTDSTLAMHEVPPATADSATPAATLVSTTTSAALLIAVLLLK